MLGPHRVDGNDVQLRIQNLTKESTGYGRLCLEKFKLPRSYGRIEL